MSEKWRYDYELNSIRGYQTFQFPKLILFYLQIIKSKREIGFQFSILWKKRSNNGSPNSPPPDHYKLWLRCTRALGLFWIWLLSILSRISSSQDIYDFKCVRVFRANFIEIQFKGWDLLPHSILMLLLILFAHFVLLFIIRLHSTGTILNGRWYYQ